MEFFHKKFGKLEIVFLGANYMVSGWSRSAGQARVFGILWNDETLVRIIVPTMMCLKANIDSKMIDLEDKIKMYMPGKVYVKGLTQCDGYDSWTEYCAFDNYSDWKRWEICTADSTDGWRQMWQISEKEYARETKKIRERNLEFEAINISIAQANAARAKHMSAQQ